MGGFYPLEKEFNGHMSLFYDLLAPLKGPIIRLLITLILVLGLFYYLFGTIRFKDYGDFIIRLLDVAAWPTVILILVILFYDSIVKLMNALAEYLISRTGRGGPKE
ncbi:MAG TPA: hypothetical protein ACFYEA_05995 [Candidatus Tripitaka californicus]|uniref:hypothetical protein n=1 Tax=Candidatus Tripitaka californicus TaxID=3367616 RepID=UPI0040284D57|nr:hypothetical protein [Planctomycetota bacterium]